VRLVYLDEAGISNPEHEPYVVVAGVIVDADKKLVAIERELQKIVQRFIPAQYREGFVFHAKEIFNGGKKNFIRDHPDWPDHIRTDVADALARIPRKFNIPVVIGHVERKNFPSTFDGSSMSTKDKTIGAHLVAYVSCIMLVERWMRREASNEVSMIVVEDNEQARTAIKDAQRIYKSGYEIRKAFPDGLTDKEKYFFPLRKIKHAPLFEPKEPASVLQIADYCAYVAKRRFMDSPFYRPYFDLLIPQIALVDIPWEKKPS
jgi:hypothetical protein